MAEKVLDEKEKIQNEEFEQQNTVEETTLDQEILNTEVSEEEASSTQESEGIDNQAQTIQNEEQNIENKQTNEDIQEACEEKLSELEVVQNKLNALNDKYLRLTAEFDNYRKRTLKEKIEMTKTAGEDILINILPVMDNFERALKSIDDAKDIEAVKQGITLIYNNFKDFLTQKGVKEVVAIEEPFNVDLHEALTKIPAPNKKLKGKVVDVIEKGYYLFDKVIRYAKVVVGE